jgi:hypothetical protein
MVVNIEDRPTTMTTKASANEPYSGKASTNEPTGGQASAKVEAKIPTTAKHP